MSAKETISKNWGPVQQAISAKFNDFQERFGNIDISNKMTSEFMSAIVETAFAEVLSKNGVDVSTPKKDSEPDAYVQGEPVEIKTTSGDQWRGGTFSKRPGIYLLVSWEYDEEIGTKLFAAMQDMEESDWQSSMLDEDNNLVQGANYYATTYGKKKLVSQNKYEILSGSIEVNRYMKSGFPRRVPTIKIIRSA